jgi:uracil-DNA glycosylase
MNLKTSLGDSWHELLKGEFEKEYMLHLSKKITSERTIKTIYPKQENVFNAYKLTPYDKVRVVIIGQDPYFNPDEAHGLSFSIQDAVKVPPSLRIIFKAIEQTIYGGFKIDQDPDLTRWASQGVFLLNKILTVEKGKPLSHKGYGWEFFTAKTIDLLNRSDNKICYLLMGKEAQSVKEYINKDKHIVFCVEHPAASGYAGRDWNHENVFKAINLYHDIKW